MEEEILEDEEMADEQPENRRNPADHLKPWQFKPGQCGNPNGRPKGISLKEFAKNMLATMTDEERFEFMKGLNKDKVWEMAEGKPQADITTKGEPIKSNAIIFAEFTQDEANSK